MKKIVLPITIVSAVIALALVTSTLLMSSAAAQSFANPGYGLMYGCPMRGGWGWYPQPPPNTIQRLDIENVIQRLEIYVSSLGNFRISEVMEFTNNFYAVVVEADTGIGAFELLVDPYTGIITFEPGPNMMWNLKYGMHNRMYGRMWWQTSPVSEMPISIEEAKKIAYSYLSRIFPGREIEVEEPTRFYGYYTLDYELGGRIHGMLSVNGFTGAVWYHSWHGEFIQEKELS